MKKICHVSVWIETTWAVAWEVIKAKKCMKRSELWRLKSSSGSWQVWWQNLLFFFNILRRWRATLSSPISCPLTPVDSHLHFDPPCPQVIWLLSPLFPLFSSLTPPCTFFTEKSYKWGIIGCGKISHDFALALDRDQRSTIVACAARRLSSAQQFAKGFDIPKAYGNYESLAKDPNIDAVYVGTIHPTHCQNVLNCLNAGKHVVVEVSCHPPLPPPFPFPSVHRPPLPP